MTDFPSLGLHELLLRALEKHGFAKPTEIQAGAIPPLMDGQDLIGLAETGTGKTAAFLLPVLHRLLEEPAAPTPNAPRALILAPTRELASQIGDAMNTLSNFIHLRSAVVYGGAPMNKQINKLRAGVDILIATPGRLMDHQRRGSVRFDETEIFILDEADRMLDMGFIHDVQTIAGDLPSEHQTVMFSATINKSVEKLAKGLLKDPVRIDISKGVSVSEQVSHRVMHLRGEDKLALTKEILQEKITGQVIVFTKTKRGADKLSLTLYKAGLKCDAIHGDRNQRQRQRTLNRFRGGAIDILIATDVAARGIDVPGVAAVINYDLPLEPEAYVHRVGRTGRNGADGSAISFCTPGDIRLLKDIEHLLQQAIEIDADHAFHIAPPTRQNKPKKKKGAAPKRSPRRGRTQTTAQHRDDKAAPKQQRRSQPTKKASSAKNSVRNSQTAKPARKSAPQKDAPKKNAQRTASTKTAKPRNQRTRNKPRRAA